MAKRVTIVYEEASEGDDKVLLVDARGVSGGDRCHELKPGQRVELWLGRDAQVTLRQQPD